MVYASVRVTLISVRLKLINKADFNHEIIGKKGYQMHDVSSLNVFSNSFFKTMTSLPLTA